MKKGEEGWLIAFILCLSALVIPIIAQRSYKSLLLPTMCGALALIIAVVSIIWIFSKKK